jgi:hypothetical protein
MVELCEPVAFAYSIVNSGNHDIADAVRDAILAGSKERITDFIKSKLNPPSAVTALLAPSASGGLTADVLTDVGGGIAGGIIGGVAGAALAVAVKQLLGIGPRTITHGFSMFKYFHLTASESPGVHTLRTYGSCRFKDPGRFSYRAASRCKWPIPWA